MDIENEFMNDMEYKMAAKSMPYFMTEILGYEMKPFHKEWSDLLIKNHRNCIICSRDHGKSILVSLVYPLWHMVFSPQINPNDIIDNYNSVIISNSLNQSTELISRIKTVIETNDFLSTINIDKRSSMSKVRMLEKNNRNRIDSLSFGSSIRGLHPRIVIVDDPLNERDSNESIYKFFFADMLPLVKHDGYLNVVGTPFSYDDLYSELKKPEKNFNVNSYPAIKAGTEEVLWPERWSYDLLMERKALQGDWLFSREYLCNPIDDSTSIFPSDLVRGCIDTRIGFQQYPNPEHRYVIGADWSIGTKTSSDYAVITVLDDYKGNLTIANIWRENQVDYDVQIDALLNFNKIYKPSRIFIEDNAFQAVFKQILSKQRIPVRGYTTTKLSKERDVYSLHSAFENKRVVLPKGTPESQELINRLETELLAFGYKNGKLEARIGHDDMVMSLVIAVACANSFPTYSAEGGWFYNHTEKIMDIKDLDMNKFKSPFTL